MTTNLLKTSFYLSDRDITTIIIGTLKNIDTTSIIAKSAHNIILILIRQIIATLAKISGKDFLNRLPDHMLIRRYMKQAYEMGLTETYSYKMDAVLTKPEDFGKLAIIEYIIVEIIQCSIEICRDKKITATDIVASVRTDMELRYLFL